MSGAHSRRLELSPSPTLAAAVLGVHAAAAGCVAAIVPGPAGTAIAALLLALGAVTAWDRALLRGSRALRAIELAAPDRAVIALADGTRHAVMPGRQRRVGRFWVTLPAGLPTRPTILVTADMLDREAFRLLRLWALWGRVADVASGQPRA